MDEDFAAAFGAVLRSVRMDRGLSQSELAFKAAIHRNYVGQLERGLKQPTLATIFYLADALMISASQLIERVEEQRAKDNIQPR